MPGENSVGGKVDPSLHQIEERVFSLGANDSHVGQVDDQFARSQVLACISPGCANLSNPDSDEGSFHEQSAPRRRVSDGYPEHAVLVPNLAPKPGTARRLPKPCPGNLLNLLTLQRAETGVSKIVKITRQLSTVETGKAPLG